VAHEHFHVAIVDDVVLLLEQPVLGVGVREQPVDVPHPAQAFRLNDHPETRIGEVGLDEGFTFRIGAVDRDEDVDLAARLPRDTGQRLREIRMAAIDGDADGDSVGHLCRHPPPIRAASLSAKRGAVVSLPVSTE